MSTRAGKSRLGLGGLDVGEAGALGGALGGGGMGALTAEEERSVAPLRRQLVRSFPGVEFEVTVESIRRPEGEYDEGLPDEDVEVFLRWTDGPWVEEVYPRYSDDGVISTMTNESGQRVHRWFRLIGMKRARTPEGKVQDLQTVSKRFSLPMSGVLFADLDQHLASDWHPDDGYLEVHSVWKSAIERAVELLGLQPGSDAERLALEGQKALDKITTSGSAYGAVSALTHTSWFDRVYDFLTARGVQLPNDPSAA